MRRMLRELWEGETGLTTVEYAILLALVAVASILVWRHLGRHVRRTARMTARTMPLWR